MKALVLCAGKGTRLQPITYSLPKHVIPIANQPIVFHIIKKLVNLGITEIGLIVGYKQEIIREVVGNGSKLGAKVEYIVQDEPKGLAHAVKIGQSFVGSEPFMVFLGDNIFEDDLSNLVKRYEKEKPDSIIILKEVDEPQRFGIAIMEEDRLVKVVEKPKDPPSNLAIAGVYIFDERVFFAIDNLKPSWRGEYEITDAIQELIDQNLVVKGEILNGKWLDTGKPEDILDANQYLIQKLKGLYIHGFIDENSSLKNSVYIGKNSKIENCKIIGPIIIGEKCFISNSTLYPNTCIGNDSKIVDTEIENSIIMKNCSILNIKGKISDSIIGENVKINFPDKIGTIEKKFKLILGNDAIITGE
ncbi:MAG: glucose-1-phosphate thymidylyltransferase [Candidatus Cloacimonetes bacterium]|nr:glucose-1-phosphate thymidylyltransferase [Candidatus Cloacimonadota bacterium]